jgi:NADH:ubiquinone oxidoreductase subunit 6 (subunit J)
MREEQMIGYICAYTAALAGFAVMRKKSKVVSAILLGTAVVILASWIQSVGSQIHAYRIDTIIEAKRGARDELRTDFS